MYQAATGITRHIVLQQTFFIRRKGTLQDNDEKYSIMNTQASNSYLLSLPKKHSTQSILYTSMQLDVQVYLHLHHSKYVSNALLWDVMTLHRH